MISRKLRHKGEMNIEKKKIKESFFLALCYA